MPLNVISTQTMGRKRPSTMGRSLHVTVTTAPDPETGTPLVTVSAPGGLSAKAPTQQAAMEQLNRKIQDSLTGPQATRAGL
jgi:hypothetical protein